jgi:hypothetical protein
MEKEKVEEYLQDILEDLEFCTITGCWDKLRQTIGEIYDEGYVDGGLDFCERRQNRML